MNRTARETGPGRERRARHVEDVLKDVLKKWRAGKLEKGLAVKGAWAEALGEKEKEHAHPVNFRKGVITVIVDNSSWLYRLTVEKRGILEKFNKVYSGRMKAKDIRFRVGSVE